MRPHVQRVLAGEYALPDWVKIEGEPTILDIGANVGAFTLWAAQQWPTYQWILCYEPHPDNEMILRHNVAHLRRVLIHPVAVSPDDRGGRLYEGRNNCGEASLFRGDEQTEHYVVVPNVQPDCLVEADIVKIDTEGSELDILDGYEHLDHVSAVMLEWHSPSLRWACGALLVRAGLECVRETQTRTDRGIMIWARTGA